jgi:hypothetical protein
MVPVFVKHSLTYWDEVLYWKKFVLSALFILLNMGILTFILVQTYKVIRNNPQSLLQGNFA